MPSLARRIARNHCIDANIIGSAVVDLKCNPLSWSDRGTYEEVLQELKLLWHSFSSIWKTKSEVE